MNSETVLITRPRGDEMALTEALQARGLHIIHEPLLEIFLRHTERQTLHRALLQEPDAVIVTSRHGVRALAALTEMRDHSLLCVGEATADAAQSLGFLRATAAGGTGERLIEYITGSYDEDSRFLYLSGEHTRIDIAAALQRHGMRAERIALYEATAAQQLSDTLAEHIRRRQVDVATFLSPRTAEIFLRLCEKADVLPSLAAMHAICLSDAVATPLSEVRWRSLVSAGEPTLASLVHCVDNALKTN